MRITEKIYFEIVEDIEYPITCTFKNRAGSWDSIFLMKGFVKELKTKPEFYYSGNVQRVKGISNTTAITYFSQWYEKEYAEWLKDLLLSPEVYINTEYIKLSDYSFVQDSEDDLIRIVLEVLPEFDENYLKK